MVGNDDSSSFITTCLIGAYVISFALSGARLAGLVEWSWWIVLFPVWASAFVVAAFLVGAAVVLIVAEIVYFRDRARWQRQCLQEDTQTA
ncbi:MAG: hypothetical protein GF418_10955 [Chitinivibrionales bacterium]|nr:hypothetical protein [Chitinivibrionales bacterium]MBD3396134.1 hypothetical protein [Chitinivibrionales bacterium]